MIFHDEYGFLVDQTSDGGDSAMRTGVLATFGTLEDQIQMSVNLFDYENDGLCVRHPTDVPWNRPENFTRDQLIPLMAGFYSVGYRGQPRRIFWSHARRLFFGQNKERDYEGSTKYPYPHAFINDKGMPETRNFDFRDPMFPDHIWHMIKCARLYFLYPFALIGIPWFIASMFFHGRSNHKEHNQMVSMAKVQGKWAVRLFKKWTPNWQKDLWVYWNSRSEHDYADLIIRDLESE